MRLPIRAVLAPLIALVVFATIPSTSAQQPPRPLSSFGLNTYFTGLERNGRDGEAGVATLAARGRAIGATWAREELSWGNLERDGKGRWSWSLFDRRLLTAHAAGYGIVGMLLTTPRWARVSDCGARIERYAFAGVRSLDYWCPPATPQDFADYVTAVVERYDGDGNADAPGSPRVDAWQIWNEPNHWETWPGTPAEYGAILQAGYAAAKAADPSAIVATGGLYVLDGAWSDGIGHNDGLRFLAQAIAAYPAAWQSFDALAIHPYMPDVAPQQPGVYGAVTLWGRIVTARSWLDERTNSFGGATRPLWISELGWSTCSSSEADCSAGAAALDGKPRLVGLSQEDKATGGQGGVGVFLGPMAAGVYTEAAPADGAQAPESSAGGKQSLVAAELAQIAKTEAQQADYLAQSYGIALALGVQHLSWFQLEDKFDGTARNFWEEAAIFRSAASGYAPKPAAFAYAVLVGELGGATFLGLGPLHNYTHTPTASAAAGRFHLRFRAADGGLIDMLWRNSGTEAVALPLDPGTAATLVTRDGSRPLLETTGGLARLELSEAPVYVRRVPVVRPVRVYLPTIGR